MTADSKERRKLYLRVWALRNPEKIKEASRQWKERNPGKWNEHTKKSVAKHPEKLKARKAVRHAVKLGRLLRLPCEVCGNLKTHAHHEDYSHPFFVQWLCQKHHADRHTLTIIRN